VVGGGGGKGKNKVFDLAEITECKFIKVINKTAISLNCYSIPEI
jgi:hypothetical protein